jgi:pimeloyl-ACP methyl ester carboxylesterase
MKANRLVLLPLTFLGILYLLYVSFVYFNQEEMVFHASKLPADYQFQFDQKFEELKITSFDGKKLNGLLFTTQNPKGLIFYLHGNTGSIEAWGNNAQIYTDLGYDIFFLDYRGFGKSEGVIENQEQIFKDVSIAYDQVASKYKNNNIVIIGYSIGTGLASYLSSVKNPHKLILQAPFYNFLEFTKGKVLLFPDSFKKFQFETNKYIVKVNSPIYIFHGNQDRLIPVENSIRLQKLLKPIDVFYKLQDEDHFGINDNAEFQQKLKEILN